MNFIKSCNLYEKVLKNNFFHLKETYFFHFGRNLPTLCESINNSMESKERTIVIYSAHPFYREIHLVSKLIIRAYFRRQIHS